MYTKKDLILHAKSYIDKLSEGINPLNNLKIDDVDVVKEERIIKCFQHISTWLYEYAQQLKKEEYEKFVKEIDNCKKNIKKQPKKKSSPKKTNSTTPKTINTITHANPTKTYKSPKKSCNTCKHYRNNNCGGIKLCSDYEYAPTFSPKETSYWPKEGDATYFKRTGRSRN